MRALTETEQSAVDQLANAFRGVKHGLWTDDRINAAPSRFADIKALQNKGEGAWSPQEINWLYFKAATTVGDDKTVKYAFVRIVELLLRDAISGSTSDSIITSKLEYAHFAEWPQAQRDAAITALEVLAAHWMAQQYWDAATMAELYQFIAQHRRT